jgi:hypothetical protein
MFFVTYLRRELRRRMRQAVFIALGLRGSPESVDTLIELIFLSRFFLAAM